MRSQKIWTLKEVNKALSLYRSKLNVLAQSGSYQAMLGWLSQVSGQLDNLGGQQASWVFYVKHKLKKYQVYLIGLGFLAAIFYLYKQRLMAPPIGDKWELLSPEDKVRDYLSKKLLGKRRIYIPLHGTRDQGLDSKRVEMKDQLYKFIGDQRYFTMLVLGAAGTGKSRFAKKVAQEILESKEHSNCIPIFIELASIDSKDINENLVESALKQYGLSAEEAKTLIRDSGNRFVFIFDGVDEIYRKSKDSIDFFHRNKIASRFPQSHVIFTCRPEIFSDSNYQDYFSVSEYDSNVEDAGGMWPVLSLSPFDEADKEQYIKAYNSKQIKDLGGGNDAGVANAKEQLLEIKNIEGLDTLTNIPIYLKMTMEVFRYVIAYCKDNTLQQSKRIEKTLYHMYTHKFLIRAANSMVRRNKWKNLNSSALYKILVKYAIRVARIMSEDDVAILREQHSERGVPVFFASQQGDEENFQQIGYEGCDLLDKSLNEGLRSIAFQHYTFRSYFFGLTPATLSKSRKEIMRYMR